MVCRTKKHCPGCCRDGDEIPAERFGKNAARPDGLQAQCRECLKDIQKASRQKHAEAERVRSGRVSARRRALLRLKLFQVLSDKSCIDCGEDDPVVLEFDHREGVTKEAAVGRLLSDAAPWPRIEAEIAKCDVRCANCHRRKTARERGSYRLQLPDGIPEEPPAGLRLA